MKHFLSVNEVDHLAELVSSALAYKADPFKDADLGYRKRLGMLFLNPSMRTRISTQIADKRRRQETAEAEASNNQPKI